MPNISETAQHIYSDLLKNESEQGSNDDIIVVGQITPSSYEYDSLIESGVSPEEMKASKITRGKLLDAGFIFNNHIGGGEKAIISELNGQPLRRSLLTADEIQTIQATQEMARCKASVTKELLPEIREGMVYFLVGAAALHATTNQRKSVLFRGAQSHVIEHGSGNEIEATQTLFSNILSLHTTDKIDATIRLNFLMERCLANIDTDFVGKIPVTMPPSRRESLRGASSPFLDSGFRFGVNYDVTMFNNDPPRTRRLNMVNIHLLSRGIDETGASTNGSHDQTYITAVEFQKYAKDIATDATMDASEHIPLIAKRLVAAATENKNL